MDNDQSMDDIIKEFTTAEAVNIAKHEKIAGEFVEEKSLGTLTKDYPSPQQELDLHGMTSSDAKWEIEKFIQNTQSKRIRTVRIITGKGLHSPHQKSIIPQATEQKLSELKKNGIVLSFKWEKQKGAIVVYLT